jgi:transcriptional regulator with XRE-family HTH domain
MLLIEREDFGRQVRRYRERRGLTQAALAGLSTVSERAVRNLELGQVGAPRRDTVHLLAEALRLGEQERIAFMAAADMRRAERSFERLFLPATTTRERLHGRDLEVAELVEHLVGGQARVVSVNGFAGVGKTRLADAVARTLTANHGIPVVWASLPQRRNGFKAADGADGAAPATEATALLSQERQGGELLAGLVGDRVALLVVDGNDAGQVDGTTIRRLVATCPRLRVLETSRTPHGPGPDHQMTLDPLPVGTAALETPHETPDSPALAVLLDAIASARSGLVVGPRTLAACAEICRSLDGLPGALQSAASWFTLMSPEEIVTMARDEPHLLAAHPGDGPSGMEPIREAITVQPSFHRELLMHLCSWKGSWTVERVVAALDLPRIQVARAVHSFLRCGLVLRDAPRDDSQVWFSVINVLRSCLAAEGPGEWGLQGGGAQAECA